MTDRFPLKLITASCILAVAVIWMGGFTRITDSGLGCPDWPGCFGEMVMTTDAERLAYLQERYPEIHVAAHKGWIEMIHRYIATILGFVILVAAVIGIRKRHEPNYPAMLSVALLGLVILQGAFGAWTVTMKLLHKIVTVHLFGGLLILSVLLVLRERLRRLSVGDTQAYRTRPLVMGGIVVLFIQIILGGWVSTNYAGWACPGLISCAPGGASVAYDFKEGFDIFMEIGPNYEGGQLHLEARAAIQMVHRAGALAVVLYWGWLLWTLMRQGALARGPAMHFAGLTVVQIVFGYANVIYAVPDSLAFIHHVLAVLLLWSAWKIAFQTSIPIEEGSYGRIEHA